MLDRADRGLLSYDDCTLEELQRFVHDRGLTATKAVEDGEDKKKVVALLEAAGEEQVQFRKFLNLPPEFRICLTNSMLKIPYRPLEANKCGQLNIYKMHFTISEKLHSRAQPLPVCSVSGLVRQETLKLFYQHQAEQKHHGASAPRHRHMCELW